jgi:replication initiation and membrane attachment protein
MKTISLLPADIYTVINKSILTEIDKKNLITLYEPIIGPLAVSLYLTLWRDLDKLEIMSIDYTHHHLMTILKSSLDTIKTAREALEGIGLLKTFIKEDEINSYVYELYSPLSATEFFNHPIFNIVLYNNIGKKEYDLLKKEYEKLKVNLNDYKDITKMLDMSFKSASIIESKEIKEHTSRALEIENKVDFDLITSAIPKGIISERAFNKKTKELINQLAFLYNYDSLKMAELIRTVINEKGFIDKEELRINARKYYQYNNNGNLPTLVYRTQPEYLKSPSGDTSNKGRIIHVFETTSPYDFLKSKYKGVKPTTRDLKLLEYLIVDLELKPAVVNVLIDYVLRRNNNKLNQAFIETIAGQWKRLNIKTAADAMSVAEKEHKKYTKKVERVSNKKITEKEPVWFNEKIEKKEISQEEKEELEELLKEFK